MQSRASRRPRSLALVPGLLLVLAAACHSGTTTPPATPYELSVEAHRTTSMPTLGTDSTLDVGTWNLEWFGDTGNGPDDEELQLENVQRVLGTLAMDLWSIQEVTSTAHFDRLLAGLDGYEGFLADDPSVRLGPDYYSDFGGNELKVGLIYHAETVTVDSARVILTSYDYQFAGRPPVEVHLTATDGTTPIPMVVVLIHAKAGADSDDRDRRAAGAHALKDYLDTAYPDRRVLVAGDFNDDVDTSIASGQESPYAPFIQDSAHYRFPTAAISAAGDPSTVFYPDVIDHHLVTDETLADYVHDSAIAFRADRFIDGYGQTTSDHYPVLARYAPWTAGAPSMVATTGDLGHAALAWTGARTALVDIYRDGTRVTTTDNDGEHTDVIPLPDGGTATYRVCDAESDRCSNEAVAVF